MLPHTTPDVDLEISQPLFGKVLRLNGSGETTLNENVAWLLRDRFTRVLDDHEEAALADVVASLENHGVVSLHDVGRMIKAGTLLSLAPDVPLSVLLLLKDVYTTRVGIRAKTSAEIEGDHLNAPPPEWLCWKPLLADLFFFFEYNYEEGGGPTTNWPRTNAIGFCHRTNERISRDNREKYDEMVALRDTSGIIRGEMLQTLGMTTTLLKAPRPPSTKNAHAWQRSTASMVEDLLMVNFTQSQRQFFKRNIFEEEMRKVLESLMKENHHHVSHTAHEKRVHQDGPIDGDGGDEKSSSGSSRHLLRSQGSVDSFWDVSYSTSDDADDEEEDADDDGDKETHHYHSIKDRVDDMGLHGSSTDATHRRHPKSSTTPSSTLTTRRRCRSTSSPPCPNVPVWDVARLGASSHNLFRRLSWYDADDVRVPTLQVIPPPRLPNLPPTQRRFFARSPNIDGAAQTSGSNDDDDGGGDVDGDDDGASVSRPRRRRRRQRGDKPRRRRSRTLSRMTPGRGGSLTPRKAHVSGRASATAATTSTKAAQQEIFISSPRQFRSGTLSAASLPSSACITTGGSSAPRGAEKPGRRPRKRTRKRRGKARASNSTHLQRLMRMGSSSTSAATQDGRRGGGLHGAARKGQVDPSHISISNPSGFRKPRVSPRNASSNALSPRVPRKSLHQQPPSGSHQHLDVFAATALMAMSVGEGIQTEKDVDGTMASSKTASLRVPRTPPQPSRIKIKAARPHGEMLHHCAPPPSSSSPPPSIAMMKREESISAAMPSNAHAAAQPPPLSSSSIDGVETLVYTRPPPAAAPSPSSSSPPRTSKMPPLEPLPPEGSAASAPPGPDAGGASCGAVRRSEWPSTLWSKLSFTDGDCVHPSSVQSGLQDGELVVRFFGMKDADGGFTSHNVRRAVVPIGPYALASPLGETSAPPSLVVASSLPNHNHNKDSAPSAPPSCAWSHHKRFRIHRGFYRVYKSINVQSLVNHGMDLVELLARTIDPTIAATNNEEEKGVEDGEEEKEKEEKEMKDEEKKDKAIDDEESSSIKRIVFVGHSMGAALAIVAAYQLVMRYPQMMQRVYVVQFGAPKYCRRNFAEWIEHHMQGRLLQLVLAGDATTRLPPPPLFGWYSPGPKAVITHQMVEDAPRKSDAHFLYWQVLRKMLRGEWV